MLVYDHLVWLPLLGVVITATLLWYSRRLVGQRDVVPFRLVIFLALGWSLVVAINMSITGLNEKIFLLKTMFLFVPFISVAIFCLLTRLIGQESWSSRRNLLLLSIVPIVTVIMAWTLDSHDLFLYDIHQSATPPYALISSYGIWYVVYLAYAYLLIAAALLTFVFSIHRSQSLFRRQGAVIIIAFTLPFVFDFLGSSEIIDTGGYDLVPAAFAFSGVLLAWGIYRYRFLDLRPIARGEMIDNMEAMLLVVDKEGRLIDINRPARLLLDRHANDLLGAPIKDSLPFGDQLQEMLRGEAKEGQLFMQAGEERRTLQATIAPIHARGESRGSMIVLRDVTELKKVQDELRRSEARFRQVAEVAGEFIWEVDAAGFYTYCSPAVEDILGYKPDELVGKKHFFDLFIPEVRETYTAAFKDALGRKAPIHNLINENNHKDGHLVILSTSGLPVLDDNGTVMGYRGTDLNVTESKIIEDRLRQSEERYRNMIRMAPFPIIISNLIDGVPILFNQAALDYFKVHETAAKGARIKDYFVDIKDMNDILSELLTFGKIENKEVRMQDSVGRVFWTDISATLIDFDGTKAVFSMFSYIEDRRQATEALRATNSKLNLLSNITRHDLINNLTAIRGNVYLAENEEDPARLSGYLMKIDRLARSAEALAGFTKDYQDLGSTAPMWQEVGETLQKAANQLALDPTVLEHSPMTRMYVLADPLLVKVFYNLLENAVRHGRVNTIKVSTEVRGNVAVIIVEDDGVGVPADRKDKIFQRGFGANTGLGLFLAKEILAITDMEIREVGEPSKGAKFEITVPDGSYRWAS